MTLFFFSHNTSPYLEENKDKYNYQAQTILYQKETITRDQLIQLVEYLGLNNGDNSADAPWKILLRPEAQKLVAS
ncbi:unnamed protein product [Mucor circinelloides]